jgi:lipopolysaccharide/colanic/teichoic acid biosynthesis glycosyltransferase
METNERLAREQELRRKGVIQKIWTELYKRPFDLTILVLAHILLLPLWVFLWVFIPVFIKLKDGGPVFYRQKRVGKDGKIIEVVKFRTMVLEAEKLGTRWTSPWKADGNDPRVTRIGRILRRTGLDELPQVILIFKGDMSLVGPRAKPVNEHDAFSASVAGWSQRLKLRPGVTGLAQIRDPSGEPNFALKCDLEYMEKMNPLLDLKILFLSVLNTLLLRWDRKKT